ncbi:MAG: hypothetical protein EKK62_04105 [Acidimicrobiia bacterium]|nr:MAG: hypothetical protein EKK62_04105 [Acidimicrobiia bacterium]
MDPKTRIQGMISRLGTKIEIAGRAQQRAQEAGDAAWKIHNLYRAELETQRDDLRKLLLDLE